MGLISRFITSYNRLKERDWDKLYVAVDIHETILVPSYHNLETYNFYPLAEKTLKLMSKRKDICLILWTSSWGASYIRYQEYFKNKGINFTHINKNPECENTDLSCFNTKWYFDVGIDDRCGFNAKYEWIPLYIYFTWKSLKDQIQLKITPLAQYFTVMGSFLQ